LFFEKGSTLDVQLIKTQGWSHAVIKPAVSANAHLTESFSVPDAENALAPFQSPAHRRDWIVQSFMPEIHSTGEISLIYFNKQYSHAVLKTPAQGDFRVQADYGGSATAYQPSQKLIEAGAEILARVPQTLLYARVDGVVRNNQLFLMELELIEPELFFHLAPCSRERFVTATIDILNSTALR
jgi:glutathione synthase/RimK-type ligase-like ATP-grasp enzyme